MIARAAAVLLVVATLVPSSPAAAAQIDWRDQAIYMIVTDRFRDGDPTNDLDSDPARADWWHGGDLQGVIDELDYIKGLGMTAIWITPFVAQTKGGYHGYWTLDATRVDPHLGTPEKLDELVREAHARGLKVVFDVVLNHLGYDHPWLGDPAHAGFFHPQCLINFADQSSVENCWLAGLPDLNTENAAVRAYLVDVWSAWLARTGVDGVRIDAARHMPKDFLSFWISRIRSVRPDLFVLGEVYSSGYRYQSGFLGAGLDAVTDFQTYDSVRVGLAPRGDLAQLALPPTLAEDLATPSDARRAIFIDNHDVPRFVGPDAAETGAKARLAQALVYLFTMPGIPVLYYGTEIALPGGADPDDRRSMAWSGGDESTRQLVRDLASLRQAVPALRRGDFTEIVSEHGEVVYERRPATGDIALVAINGEDSRTVDVPFTKLGILGAILERTLGPGASARTDGAGVHLELAPRAAVVLVLSPASPLPANPYAIAALIIVFGALVALAIIVRARRRAPRSV